MGGGGGGGVWGKVPEEEATFWRGEAVNCFSPMAMPYLPLFNHYIKLIKQSIQCPRKTI